MIELNYKILIQSSLTAILGLFSYYTLKIYLQRRKYKHLPGPPANGILGFYLGNTIELLNKQRQGVELVDILTEWLLIN